MRFLIHLAAPDAERLGLAVIDYQSDMATLNDLIEVQERYPDLNWRTLPGRFVTGDFRALKAMAWLGLRQAGRSDAWDDVTFAPYAATVERIGQEQPEPGKAQEEAKPSVSSSTRSPRTSRKRSASTAGSSAS